MLKDVRPVGELHRSRTGRIIRRGWLPGVLTAALAVWPGLPAAAQAAQDRIEPSVADDVDRAVNPGDDFFAYANGGWLARTEIPAGLDRWNARTEIEALTGRQVARLLDAAAEQPPGSLARKVADFQAAYLAEDRIEAKGLAPVASQLDSIDQVRTKGGWRGCWATGCRRMSIR
jgi:hypothetical protein